MIIGKIDNNIPGRFRYDKESEEDEEDEDDDDYNDYNYNKTNNKQKNSYDYDEADEFNNKSNENKYSYIPQNIANNTNNNDYETNDKCVFYAIATFCKGDYLKSCEILKEVIKYKNKYIYQSYYILIKIS